MGHPCRLGTHHAFLEPASTALISMSDRPIVSSRSSALSRCGISSELSTLSSLATIRSWTCLPVLKVPLLKRQPIRRQRCGPPTTSHTLPYSQKITLMSARLKRCTISFYIKDKDHDWRLPIPFRRFHQSFTS